MENNQSIINKQIAFMQLYEPAHERLYRFVQSLVWDKDDAKDIVNETALKAFEKFDSIKNKEVFVSYLFSIASNLSKKRYRISKIKAAFDWSKADEMKAWQHAESTVNIDELNKLLSLLSFEQRRAFVLFELSGFSYDEISEIEQCSLSAIKSRIYTAKQKLKKYLLEEEFQIQNLLLKSIIA